MLNSLNNGAFLEYARKCFNILLAPNNFRVNEFMCENYNYKSTEESLFLTKMISFRELNHTINILKSGSAPGIDKILYDILKSLPEFFKKALLDVFNYFLFLKMFPDQWRNFLISFIPKNNGKARPIASNDHFQKLI